MGVDDYQDDARQLDPAALLHSVSTIPNKRHRGNAPDL